MLEERLKNLPSSAGVYQYFDKNGRLLYVGKAKNLKNRIKSYFKSSPQISPSSKLSSRIHKMISETANLEYILVENEHDALILENSLIKQLKPKYNILLRDDKTYPYISIDLNDDFPRFEITRKITNRKNIKYFGPFTSSAKDILDAIYLIFNLVQKKGCIKSKKACLFYQIKRCPAPCENKISKELYQKTVFEAIETLKNRKNLIKLLEEKMNKASLCENYEEALRIRDMIKSINTSLHITEVDMAKLENLDIFAIYYINNIACIMKVFIREGKVISTDYNIIKNSNGFDIQELYKRVLIDFYSNSSNSLAKQILIADDFQEILEVEKYIETSIGKKIKISVPKRGEKYRLIKLALKNAKYLLERENGKKTDIIEKEIKKLFNLKETPYRIEIFDNSHLGGKNCVGAMVVWEKTFIKQAYKKYKLKGRDEYSQMEELLSRRIEKFEQNPPPDLWLIDGGETLLKLAIKLLDKKNISLDVLAISKEKLDNKSVRSKGRAKDIIHSLELSLNLPTSDKRLQFLQKLRDEAHRFAISFHKKRKVKSDLDDHLLQINGIGIATLKKLLNYFGTYENIYKASYDELINVVNNNIANIILNNK